MITIEQVEELRKRVNISYEEAKAALEETNGDMLDAVINLERRKKISAPEGGFYSTKNQHHIYSGEAVEGNGQDKYNNTGNNVIRLLKKFLSFCKKMLVKGNKNNFEVIKDGKTEMSIPVTLLAILAIFFFWITVPILVLGLFLGYRYAFKGPDLGRENINSVMNKAADMAENLKNEVKGESSDGEDFDNRG